jgi:hypothetical protein
MQGYKEIEMYEKNKQIPRFQTNIKAEHEQFVHQAAKITGFNITVQHEAHGDYLQPGYVSVWTNEPLARDHGPFWREYERLRDSQ